MAKDKIVLDADRDGYFLVWFLAEEGDMGATLGEDTYTADDLKKAKPADWAHIKATITAGQTTGVVRRGHNGYRWESAADAKRARSAVTAVLKDTSSKPWPTWAVEARAAGWKPPKNWKP